MTGRGAAGREAGQAGSQGRGYAWIQLRGAALTVFGAGELDVELADVVLYQLHLPVAHHAAGSARSASGPTVMRALSESDGGRAAHSFMTSISLRLLGDAISPRERPGQPRGPRSSHGHTTAQIAAAGGRLRPAAVAGNRTKRALDAAVCIPRSWLRATGSGHERAGSECLGAQCAC